MVKQQSQICTFRPLKSCKSISGEFDLTKMLLKSSFNMTMHEHTSLKTQEQSQNSDGLFFPTHHIAQILLPQISTTLETSRMPSMWKDLGMMIRILKKWLQGQNSGTKGGQMLLFITGARLLKYMEIIPKKGV
jgi:hypothetical protein